MARDDGRVRERLGALGNGLRGGLGDAPRGGGGRHRESGGPRGGLLGGRVGGAYAPPADIHTGLLPDVPSAGAHSGRPDPADGVESQPRSGARAAEGGVPHDASGGGPFGANNAGLRWDSGAEFRAYSAGPPATDSTQEIQSRGAGPVDEVGNGPVPGGRWQMEESFGSGGAEDEGAESDSDGAPLPVPNWLSEPVGSVSFWHGRSMPERFRGVRLNPGRRGVVVLALVGVAAIVLAGAAAQREKPVVAAVPALPSIVPGAALTSVVSGPSPVAGSQAPDPPPRVEDLVVSVVGLVEHPGLLHIPMGSRVADALVRAGTAEGADLTSLNLAQKLADGDQIVVGAAAPAALPVSTVQAGGASPTGRSPGTASGRVNLNTSTEADLDSLPGVGQSTARAILAWRTEHGHFTTIDQLGEVAGIGPSRLARLRPLVTL